MHLLEYCFHTFDKEKVELLLVVARNIWLRRNSLIFQGSFLSPHRVWEESISFLEEFRMCCQGEENVASASSQVVPSSLDVWCPPPTNYFKINWDASVAPKGSRIGLGLVARDSRGECIGAKCVCCIEKLRIFFFFFFIIIIIILVDREVEIQCVHDCTPALRKKMVMKIEKCQRASRGEIPR
jgi:hypothetical protein